MVTPAKIRLGVSKKPVSRESKTAYKQIEHRTVAIDELVDLIQSGHALGAICAGDHVYENFIGRQDIQLDIDASDFGDNPIPYFLNHLFVKQNGYLIYRTRTPGHCRIMFRLSKQITNPVQYARYADALITMFGADRAAVSCVQLWYTYAGCDVAIVGKTLPVALLDKLVNMSNDSDDYQPPTALDDPETLLQQAIDSLDGRNVAGYNLALCLRRLNMSKAVAERYMQQYQTAVCDRGNHLYTAGEAKNSLDSAYRHRKTFDLAIINDARTSVVSGAIDLPVNVRRTAFAILTAMETIGRTTSVELSIRQIARATDDHIPVMTVKAHIDVLKSAGLFRVFGNGKGRRSTYTLLTHRLTRAFGTHQTGVEGKGDTPFQSSSCLMCTENASENAEKRGEAVVALDAAAVARSFEQLQRSAATEPNAKIHPKMQTLPADELVRLGSGYQAILSVLESVPNNTVDSLETLCELTNLSWRVTSRTVQSMQLCGLVEVLRNHRKKVCLLYTSPSPRD